MDNNDVPLESTGRRRVALSFGEGLDKSWVAKSWGVPGSDMLEIRRCM